MGGGLYVHILYMYRYRPFLLATEGELLQSELLAARRIQLCGRWALRKKWRAGYMQMSGYNPNPNPNLGLTRSGLKVLCSY